VSQNDVIVRRYVIINCRSLTDATSRIEIFQNLRYRFRSECLHINSIPNEYIDIYCDITISRRWRIYFYLKYGFSKITTETFRFASLFSSFWIKSIYFYGNHFYTKHRREFDKIENKSSTLICNNI